MIDSNGTSKKTSKLFKNQNLKEFPCETELNGYQYLSFAFNNIFSFQTLPSLQTLVSLDLNNCKISSFQGAPSLPSLVHLSIKNNPVSSKKYLELMATIVFGDSLKTVNQNLISNYDKQYAIMSRKTLLDSLRQGWLITLLNPGCLVHDKTKRRKKFWISQDFENSSMKESTPKIPQNSSFTAHSNAHVHPYSSLSGDRSLTQQSLLSHSSFDDCQTNTFLKELLELSRSWNPMNSDEKNGDEYEIYDYFPEEKSSLITLRRYLSPNK